MTEQWKPTAGEECYVTLNNNNKYKTFFIGVSSDEEGVFEVTHRMGSIYGDDMPSYDSVDCVCFSPIPKTKLIHGVEVPDISFVPGENEWCYFPDPADPELFCEMYDKSPERYPHRVGYGLCYPYTEEGKQAAILRAKAMLGIADK